MQQRRGRQIQIFGDDNYRAAGTSPGTKRGVALAVAIAALVGSEYCACAFAMIMRCCAVSAYACVVLSILRHGTCCIHSMQPTALCCHRCSAGTTIARIHLLSVLADLRIPRVASTSSLSPQYVVVQLLRRARSREGLGGGPQWRLWHHRPMYQLA